MIATNACSPWCVSTALWRVPARRKILLLDLCPDLYLLNEDLPAFREYFLRFDHVVCTGSKTQAALNRLFSCGVPSSVILPVPDYEYCRRMLHLEAGDPFDTNNLNIVSAERLFPGNSAEKLPDLAERVKQSFPRLRWFLLGDGGVRNKILRDIVLKDLCENVFPYTEVEDFYSMIYHCSGVVCFENENNDAMQAARVFGVPTFMINPSDFSSGFAENLSCWLSTLKKRAPEENRLYTWPDSEQWLRIIDGSEQPS